VWQRLLHVVSRKAVDGQPRRVGHQAAQRDLLCLRVLVLRHLPALQLQIDVFVERQGAVLHEVQRAAAATGLLIEPA